MFELADYYHCSAILRTSHSVLTIGFELLYIVEYTYTLPAEEARDEEAVARSAKGPYEQADEPAEGMTEEVLLFLVSEHHAAVPFV